MLGQLFIRVTIGDRAIKVRIINLQSTLNFFGKMAVPIRMINLVRYFELFAALSKAL